MGKKAPKINTEPTKNDKIAAQAAEMMLSPGMRKLADRAFTALEDSPEIYVQQRKNRDRHIGAMAATLVNSGEKNLSENVWKSQRDIVAASLDGEGMGVFSEAFFDGIRPKGLPAESQPGDEDISHLPAGEYDVMQTNSRIVALSKEEPDPVLFIEDALAIIKSRKQQGGKTFEGPENYATTLKYFADKTHDIPLGESQKEKRENKALVSAVLSGFENVAQRDEPNIVEITNILSAVKTLPKGIVEPRFTPMILKHTVNMLDEFSARGINVLIGALGKLDVNEYPEEAAMTLDLAFRKGGGQERSRELLTALRALTNLPHSRASERAVESLLNTRHQLELASNLDELEEINRSLLKIVEDVTENRVDTQAIKGIAETVSREAWRQSARDAEKPMTLEQMDARKNQVGRIINTAKRI